MGQPIGGGGVEEFMSLVNTQVNEQKAYSFDLFISPDAGYRSILGNLVHTYAIY